MKPTSIRLVLVSDAFSELEDFYVRKLGFDTEADAHGMTGAVIDAGGSRLEVWAAGPDMPAGRMLQIVVEDVDGWADQARANGAELQGPFEAHGERMYALTAPDGMPVTVQAQTRSS